MVWFINSTRVARWIRPPPKRRSWSCWVHQKKKALILREEVPPTKYWRVEDPQSWWRCVYVYIYMYYTYIYIWYPPRDLPLAYIIMSIYIYIYMYPYSLYPFVFDNKTQCSVKPRLKISSWFNHVQPLEINNGLYVRLIGGLVWWLDDINSKTKY